MLVMANWKVASLRLCLPLYQGRRSFRDVGKHDQPYATDSGVQGCPCPAHPDAGVTKLCMLRRMRESRLSEAEISINRSRAHRQTSRLLARAEHGSETTGFSFRSKRSVNQRLELVK